VARVFVKEEVDMPATVLITQLTQKDLEVDLRLSGSHQEMSPTRSKVYRAKNDAASIAT
jgi:hypothetical protein